MKRKAGVRGRFYPQACSEITSMIAEWNGLLDAHIKDRSVLAKVPKAIIAPHAGYIYSGFTANIAHRLLANTKPKRIIVIGPSHHVYIDGMSISKYATYETPCGDLEIDMAYIKTLEDAFSFTFSDQAHFLEHSTETQMPFIKHYHGEVKVVEIIYGKLETKVLATLIQAILEDPDNAVVISTDLSHFYTLDEANARDNVCLHAVLDKDLSMLEKGCEACGMLGVKGILHAAKERSMEVALLDYRTSADQTGDKSSVVGYMSACIG